MAKQNKNKKKVEEYIVQAKNFGKRRKPDEAVRVLLEAIKDHQYVLELYRLLGLYARRSFSKDLRFAIGKLQRAVDYKVSQKPQNKDKLVKVLNELAMLHQKNHSPEDLKKAKKATGKKKSLDKAIECLQRAIELKPNETSFMILSYTYQLKGNLAMAIFTLDDGLQLFPKSSRIKERKEYLAEQNSISEFIKSVRTEMASGDLLKVFNLIKEKTEERFIEIYEGIIRKQSEYTKLKNDHERHGLLTIDQFNAKENEIKYAILRLINQLNV